MHTWELRLLGAPSLIRSDGREVRPERKTLGLLAYLALEGPTSRARLVELLWPDTPLGAARNNLVHLLRRAKTTFGTALVEGGDKLALADVLAVDARTLLCEPDEGEVPLGEFLGGAPFDDLPELSDWVLSWREELVARRIGLLGARAERAEEVGDLEAALAFASRRVDLDPLSEEAYRRVMRLHALAGDRPAALRTYHRLKDALEREFSEKPSDESVQLARAIDRGALPPAARRLRAAPLPLAVLRPPLLVGREAAWAQMEAAWRRGQLIYVTGDAGVGKTRFVQDFVASKGRALYLPGYPSARDVPFAAAAHNARARLAAANVELPAWVRRELARVLPEFREGAGPEPINSPQARLKYFLAHLEVVRLTSPGFAGIVTDDVQYYDDATVDLGAFFLTQGAPPDEAGEVPRHVMIYRRGTLPPATQARQGQLVQAGVAVVVDLAPLSPQAVEALLREVGAPASLAWELHGLTGGNPQFLLETLRHMFAAGEFGVPEALRAQASGVAQLVAARLADLSESAQQAARTAAVLRDDFTLELVAEVLGVSVLDLALAWEELEDAQVVVGERFSHDLVGEAVLHGMPPAIRTLLHRGAARVLPRFEAHPGRVAGHWLAAGDLGQAAGWFARAGEAARATSRPLEAAAFFERAVSAYEQLRDAEGARRVKLALEAARGGAG